MNAYLAGLPRGLDSHPAAQSKASLLRSVRVVMPVRREELEGLDPRIVEPLVETSLATSRIPTTVYHACQLAVADARGMNQEEFNAYWYRGTADVVQSPLYLGLFRLLEPEFIFKTAASRWSHFHTGCTLGVQRGRETIATLSYPHGLIDEFCARAYTASWQAVIDAGRKRQLVATFVDWTPTAATYRWSPGGD